MYIEVVFKLVLADTAVVFLAAVLGDELSEGKRGIRSPGGGEGVLPVS